MSLDACEKLKTSSSSQKHLESGAAESRPRCPERATAQLLVLQSTRQVPVTVTFPQKDVVDSWLDQVAFPGRVIRNLQGPKVVEFGGFFQILLPAGSDCVCEVRW